MQIDIVTIFPEMLEGPLKGSIIGRAREKGIIKINLHNLRDYAYNKHRSVDDYPYGGGPGMVMKPEPFFCVLEKLDYLHSNNPILLMTPQGEVFNQKLAQEFATFEKMAILCGHYEGIDERVRKIVTHEISIGDYVLTGGEIPALAVVDAVSRLLPGVLGDDQSAREDSFQDGLLEHPHFTRPREYKGMKVPDILLSGNHAEIARWRKKEKFKRTLERRPELLKKLSLNEEDKQLLLQAEKELKKGD
ncbi:MAG: tRNA (guanine37-N1)-methyltransferase [Clostridia bacterium]|jgi:tRNA (guanine37-N1)-methyltransferase|nr:tRNA (Guanine37-N1) -methyltransferase [Clostridiales bacterium]MDK2984731.1 tRNA (guanine37-N1)-methyltransferase [Clostridia bacterium]